MIRSKFFWIAAVLLAAIPLLVMDIPKHYVDWTREVHDEMIVTVHNQYNLSKTEKAEILDSILAANNNLMAKMYLKGFAGIVLLGLSVYFFTIYKKQQSGSFFKAAGLTVLLLTLAAGIKLYAWTSFNGNDKIQLLTLSPADISLMDVYNTHFKGKVVYVDFWGTTCGPCLEEFRNFTKPLKQRFNNRTDIAYLYVSGGRKLIWKQQIQKLDVDGAHIFLNQADYNRFYRQAINGNNHTLVSMPRYLIIDKTGKIADIDAPRPSDKDVLISKLNTCLANNASAGSNLKKIN